MKLKILTILLIIFNSINIQAIELKDWTDKKKTRIELITDFIINRESFSPICYKDGYDTKSKKYKYSLGYGTSTANSKETWCDIHIKKLKNENNELKKLSDDEVREMVSVSKEVARWKAKEYVIYLYDKLESKLNNNIEKVFDDIEITGVISLIYTIGESNFYKSTFYKKHIDDFKNQKNINCLQVRKSILSWSKVRNNNELKISKGALNRRQVELNLITHKRCVY